MVGFIIRRLLSGLVSFLIFSAILFFGVNSLIIGDYVDTLSLQLDAQERAELRAELGLDVPLPEQYIQWIGKVLRGDLGEVYSLRGYGGSVADAVGTVLPATVLVFLFGSIIALGFGIWLGQVASWSNNRFLTGSITFGSIAAYTAFPPWLVFLIGWLLVDRIGRLPLQFKTGQLQREIWNEATLQPNAVMVQMIWSLIIWLVIGALILWAFQKFFQVRLPVSVIGVLVIVGMFLLWQIGGYTAFAFDIARIAFLPFLTYALLTFGDIMLIMRSSILETKHETYISLARAKGVKERDIRGKHATRNAILPVLTRFVINLPYLMTAIVIIEYATGWTGIGDLLFRSVYDQNTFVYMGIMVVVGLVTLISRLALDIVYMLLDPRIRLAGGSVA